MFPNSHTPVTVTRLAGAFRARHIALNGEMDVGLSGGEWLLE